MDLDHLDWPFYEARHRDLARVVEAWRAPSTDHADVDASCRAIVASLGSAGLLSVCVAEADRDASTLDSRSLCVMRERLAYHDGLADFAFAMQGLGSGPVSLAGSPEQRAQWLPRVAQGDVLAAFALSEPNAGSDAVALTTRATRDGDAWVIDGCKTWISNGGIADFYCVFARTGDEPSSRSISCFLVPADTRGLRVAERIDVISPHPLARIDFEGCRLPGSAILGEPGEGFKLAMRTLDIFRASVGSAAVGFARRALDEAASHAVGRRMFGGTLAGQQLTQATLGDMTSAIDASALLVARAAWKRDVMKERTTREAAMAKLVATESAQKVIDAAVQMFGARGVQSGNIVERLYRDIRALRIYEGASEVQRLILGRDIVSRYT